MTILFSPGQEIRLYLGFDVYPAILIHESARAYLVEVEKIEKWIPKSQCDVDEDEIMVSDWLSAILIDELFHLE